MSDEERWPPAWLQSIIDAERARPALDAERVRAIRAATEQRLPRPPDGSGQGGDGGGAPPSAGPRSPLLRHLMTFALGAGVGVAGSQLVQTHDEPAKLLVAERAAPRIDAPPITQGSAVVPSIAAAAARAEPHDVPAVAAPQPARVTPAPRQTSVVDADLRAERVLIETAYSALIRREYPAALAGVEKHARRAPTGRMSEEREAIRVQCLVGLKRADEAIAAQAAFEQAFPTSMHLSTLARALGALTQAAPAASPVKEPL